MCSHCNLFYRKGFPELFNRIVEHAPLVQHGTLQTDCRQINNFSFMVAPGEADVAISRIIHDNPKVITISRDSDLWMLYPDNQNVLNPDFKNKV